jgi:hypothetical protein
MPNYSEVFSLSKKPEKIPFVFPYLNNTKRSVQKFVPTSELSYIENLLPKKEKNKINDNIDKNKPNINETNNTNYDTKTEKTRNNIPNVIKIFVLTGTAFLGFYTINKKRNKK